MAYRALEGTNTKTRRLAYLSAIVKISAGRALPEKQLTSKVVSWSQRYRGRLRDYWVKTGEITSTRGESSTRRYLNLATQLGIVATIATTYRVTRIGFVLHSMGDLAKGPNPFFLSDAERIFFFHRMLAYDADMLLTVFDLIQATPGISLSNAQRGFQALYLERLSRKIGYSENEALKRKLLDRRNAVDAWTKPDRYSEHLVAPRLNWLLDLEFLEPAQFRKHRFHLTESAKMFLSWLPTYGPSQTPDISDRWLSSEFWTAAGEEMIQIEELKEWSLISDGDRVAIVEAIVPETFSVLRQTSAPRVSLTPALLFMSLNLLLRHRLIAPPNKIEKWIGTGRVIRDRKYAVRFSARENEAYLIMSAP